MDDISVKMRDKLRATDAAEASETFMSGEFSLHTVPQGQAACEFCGGKRDGKQLTILALSPYAGLAQLGEVTRTPKTFRFCRRCINLLGAEIGNIAWD